MVQVEATRVPRGLAWEPAAIGLVPGRVGLALDSAEGGAFEDRLPGSWQNLSRSGASWPGHRVVHWEFTRAVLGTQEPCQLFEFVPGKLSAQAASARKPRAPSA
jgi:hypothetical protein